MKQMLIATLIWMFCLTGSGLCEDVFFPIVVPTAPQDGTAQQSDVRAGKYFYGLQGKRQVGTVPANSISEDTDVVPQGIYPNTVLSDVDTDLAPENIMKGVTIFGHEGTVDTVTCEEYCDNIYAVAEMCLSLPTTEARFQCAYFYTLTNNAYQKSLGGINFENECSCD